MNFEDAWKFSSAIPGWYTESEARLLWDCATHFHPTFPLLEVGSYRGRTASLLARTGGKLYVCEPFILAPGCPNDTPESEGKYVSDDYHPEIFEDFGRNMGAFEYVLWKCRSEHFPALCHPIVEFGLIHIDGDHVEGVARDAANLLPMLHPQGIAVFHDYTKLHTQFTQVQQCVDGLKGWKIVGRADSAVALKRTPLEPSRGMRGSSTEHPAIRA